MTPRAILELGCGEQGKHASDLTGGGQPRGGSEGVAQPNPGQQSHCQGTWGDLLPVPASLGFLFYFPGGERGGTPSHHHHGVPMSSAPLFPLPPPFISVGIGFFFLCPELCPPQTQTRLQVRPKPPEVDLGMSSRQWSRLLVAEGGVRLFVVLFFFWFFFCGGCFAL